MPPAQPSDQGVDICPPSRRTIRFTLAGISSGATLWSAQQVASRMERGNIVVIFGDRGERYFSTPVFVDA